MKEEPPAEPAADDPQAVLAKKDHVTKGPRGLQQWGDEGQPDEPAEGTGSTGTAARQARQK